MAINTGFFDGPQAYGQLELARYFDNIYESGVSVDEANNLTFSVYKDASVKVGTGFAIIKGFYIYSDSPISLNITPDANYNRVDRVVLRLNLANNTIIVTVIKGVPSSNPAPPSIVRDGTLYDLSLASILIERNGNTTISDERFYPNLCGTIRPKNLTEFNNMVKEFQNQFDDWFNAQQSKGWRNIYIQEQEPGAGAVVGSIWI